jgi:peptidoglycan/LPS O-acetylase OafA/YrhL
VRLLRRDEGSIDVADPLARGRRDSLPTRLVEVLALRAASSESEQRYAELDAIKSIGILVVILIHSMRAPWNPSASEAEVWIGAVTRFAVPGFLAVSGCLYAGSRSVAAALTRVRLRRILVPYALASLAAQIFRRARGAGPQTGAPPTAGTRGYLT